MNEMRADNAKKLDQVRETVDEKLQSTLEKRLGESFTLVTKRLEEVHRGLGEMQALASDVGGLKRVLTNVKVRVIYGEIQLGQLIDQVMTSAQYGTNVAVVHHFVGSGVLTTPHSLAARQRLCPPSARMQLGSD